MLMDLGAEFNPVIDTIQIIQVRLTSPRLVIPPTPQQNSPTSPGTRPQIRQKCPMHLFAHLIAA